MDLVPVVFYAAICCLLASLVPDQVSRKVRAVIGALVGIAAAVILPILRGLFGI